jgi:hypothetical protein
MLIVGDSGEHDLDANRAVEERIFIELAANTVDLVVVIWVCQVNLIWGDPDDGT